MAVPLFVTGILGWRKGPQKGVTKGGPAPNIADAHSEASVNIGWEVLRLLGVEERRVPQQEDSGTLLETGVREFLAQELPARVPGRSWHVTRRDLITDFQQYEHLARMDDLIQEDPTLLVEIGRDYLIRPDVTVGIILEPGGRPLLHAAVSCKWTIRSDRVQNIRHEGVILTRHRRGRQPHVVTVTAEPLPSRLASIARGTGEVDKVFHVALDELVAATQAVGSEEQESVLEELIAQNRLGGLESLATELAL